MENIRQSRSPPWALPQYATSERSGNLQFWKSPCSVLGECRWLDRKNLLQDGSGCQGNPFGEDDFKFDNKVPTFFRCFGERQAFSRNFPPHTRPDDIFEYNRDGPAVQSGYVHSATTESLGMQKDRVKWELA